jgi:hypothetical protein
MGGYKAEGPLVTVRDQSLVTITVDRARPSGFAASREAERRSDNMSPMPSPGTSDRPRTPYWMVRTWAFVALAFGLAVGGCTGHRSEATATYSPVIAESPYRVAASGTSPVGPWTVWTAQGPKNFCVAVRWEVDPGLLVPANESPGPRGGICRPTAPTHGHVELIYTAWGDPAANSDFLVGAAGQYVTAVTAATNRGPSRFAATKNGIFLVLLPDNSTLESVAVTTTSSSYICKVGQPQTYTCLTGHTDS